MLTRLAATLFGLLLLTVALGVGACASSSAERDPAGPTVTPTGVDGETLRGWNHDDYDIETSITGVARASETVVSGVIASWSDGRLTGFGDTLAKFAVLEVSVDRAFVAEGETRSVYVELTRGHAVIDENGNELETSVHTSVRELEAAAPAGTRVVVLAEPAASDEDLANEPGNKLISSWEPPSDDARLLRPLPQGLLLEDSDGSYVSGVAEQEDVELGDWPDTFEQLLDELTEAVSAWRPLRAR